VSNNLALFLVLFSIAANARTGEQIRYDCGDATADEQYVLQIINRARSDPKAESKRLNIDLAEGLDAVEKSRLKPHAPLAMNAKLLKAAREHSEDMYKRSFFDHKNPDGNGLVNRVKTIGYDYEYIAENIGASSKHSAAEIQDMLMIDAETPDLGHRKNLMALIKDTLHIREAGIGFFDGKSKNDEGVAHMLTEQFGTSKKSKAFLLGVVYKDANEDGFYDPGEGIAGVTIKPDRGDYYAVTNAAGGFAIPIEDGRVTLTVSGGDFEGTVKATVKVKGENIELDFVSGKADAIVNFGKGAELENQR
jgi:hypothetical protein